MNHREYHVSVEGKDSWEGTLTSPLRRISEAAKRAQAGDTITVHTGTYREGINPPRGGSSEENRIVYQAAPGEKVVIKGSEKVNDWKKVDEQIWQTVIHNDFFGDFNPYDDLIRGDWFNPINREHHTGMVYLNEEWLLEAANFEELENTPMSWFVTVDEENTSIWANFGDQNPAQELVEINVRQSVFYPEKPGVNYLTVRGFTMKHAATPWAPPTAEQIGLLGTHWSKGWIIEDNRISHSRCTGITLGKYGDEWDNVEDTADAYNRTIERALENGWSQEHIGHHIVRRNHVSHCEMAGIVGSLGACYSIIEENVLHDIHVIKAFSGAEMAAIKFHGAINTLIKGNLIYHSDEGIWLDWMTQGTRVTRNVTYDILADDLFVEVSHGPYLIDHNLFLSPNSNNVLRNLSQGGTYAHNLFMGTPEIWPQLDRATPYHHEDATSIAGVVHIEGGDDRLYNNIFIAKENLNNS